MPSPITDFALSKTDTVRPTTPSSPTPRPSLRPTHVLTIVPWLAADVLIKKECVTGFGSLEIEDEGGYERLPNWLSQRLISTVSSKGAGVVL